MRAVKHEKLVVVVVVEVAVTTSDNSINYKLQFCINCNDLKILSSTFGAPIVPSDGKRMLKAHVNSILTIHCRKLAGFEQKVIKMDEKS